MTVLAHSLERTVFILATRETVFRFFADNDRWASWWGAGSTIEPRAGGAVLMRLPGGASITGQMVELNPPERIVFTYGFASGAPIPPGGSRVTIRLEPHDDGTRLVLMHEVADAGVRDSFQQAWRYQLSLLSNIVSREVTAGATGVIDEWFAMWSITDAAGRESAIGRIAVAGVVYRDRFSAVAGAADLVPHVAAFQQQMPGLRFERTGTIRECQGYALADWKATSADGQQRASGTAGVAFDCNGRIAAVVGFWN